MAWSKSRRADENSAVDRVRAEEANGGRKDTKHFVAEMESKLGDFDARLKQRRQDVAFAEAEISELKRLVNAATQAIKAARPGDARPAVAVVGNRPAARSAAGG